MKKVRGGFHAANGAVYLLVSLLAGACGSDGAIDTDQRLTNSGAETVGLASQPVKGLVEPPREQQVRSLLAEPRAANDYTLDRTTALMRTAAGAISLSSAEGLFDRVWIHEKESIQLHVTVPDLRIGEEVVVTAPNGGKIERADGPLRFVARKSEAELSLTFTPTLGQGAYSIALRHAGAVVTFNFWAGAALPVGMPGPDYVASQQKEVAP